MKNMYHKQHRLFTTLYMKTYRLVSCFFAKLARQKNMAALNIANGWESLNPVKKKQRVIVFSILTQDLTDVNHLQQIPVE